MSTTADSIRSRAWCLFRRGPRSYAVPVHCVAEIVPVERLSPIPLGPPCLLGLLALRRDVIPVVALDVESAGSTQDPGGMRAVLVVRNGRGPWGIQIDREGTIVTEEVDDDRSSSPWSGRGRSQIRRGETVFEILDLDRSWQEASAAIRACYGRGPTGVPASADLPNRTDLHCEAER